MADNAQVRRENESLLRESLRGGAYSKNELAHRTGLSFPTVGRIVDDMVSRGEAAESGEGWILRLVNLSAQPVTTCPRLPPGSSSNLPR